MKHIAIIPFLIFNIACSSLIMAQDGIGIERAGRIYNIWDEANSVVIRDNLAYVSTNLSGLQILNISDPSSPLIVGFFDDNTSFNTNLKLVDNYAFLADESGGMCIIDIEDPQNPSRTGVFRTGRIHAVDASGDIALLAADWAGLRIVDVTDKSNPAEITYQHLPGGAYDVFTSQTFAYVAGGRFGLYIINIENPENPEIFGNYDTPGACKALACMDHLVLLIDEDNGLFIIDVSDPDDPDFLSLTELGGHAVDVAVSENTAIVTDSNDGVLIFDISNPHEPAKIGNFPVRGWAGGCAFIDDRIYVANGNAGYPDEAFGLEIFDVSNINSPEFMGSYPSPNQSLSNLTVYDGYAYIPDRDSGLRVVDVRNPENLQQIALCGDATWEGIIHVSRSYAYMAGDTFRVLDISNQENPVVLSSFEIDSYATDLSIWRSCVYLTTQNSLYVIDITQPERPVVINEFREIDRFSPNGIDIEWGYAYITGRDRLYILDISDAENPEVISEYMANAGQMQGVASDGDLLYVVDDMAGLFVLDISDRENPVRIGFLDTRPTPGKLNLHNGHIYILNGLDGFRIINVDDPTNPVQVGYFNTPGYASDISVVENYAYIADRFSFSVYDCALAIGYNIAPEWESVPDYVEADEGEIINFELIAFDVNSDQLNINIYREELPEAVTFVDQGNGRAEFRWETESGNVGEYYPAFIVSDGILSDTARTAIIVNEVFNVCAEPKNPFEFELMNVFPNPVNGTSTVIFRTPIKQGVSISLVSTEGRRISRITDAVFEPGVHSVVLNSHLVAAGVYFLKLESKLNLETLKVVILK